MALSRKSCIAQCLASGSILTVSGPATAAALTSNFKTSKLQTDLIRSCPGGRLKGGCGHIQNTTQTLRLALGRDASIPILSVSVDRIHVDGHASWNACGLGSLPAIATVAPSISSDGCPPAWGPSGDLGNPGQLIEGDSTDDGDLLSLLLRAIVLCLCPVPIAVAC